MIPQFVTLAEMQSQAMTWRESKQRIGFVPTMGALHAGHAELLRKARAQCDQLVLSIFVNPTQFGPGEDLDTYPRTLESDLNIATEHQVDAVFLPTVDSMYGNSFYTWVEVDSLTDGLCSIDRPSHFRGVTTIVCKLFNIVQPHSAYFGEKDYQQLKVIERMVHDLNMPVQIHPVPTVREADGLALSSRNQYLSAEERERATIIYATLREAQDLAKHEQSPQTIQTHVYKRLLSADLQVEYVEVVDAESLQPITELGSPARCCVAARLGNTRLIDNIAL